MSLIVSPQGEKSKEQPEAIKAFPLFGVMPGALPGTMNAIVQGGMELRDYFAGQVANQLLLNLKSLDDQEIAEACYYFADAMIIARGATKS